MFSMLNPQNVTDVGRFFVKAWLPCNCIMKKRSLLSQISIGIVHKSRLMRLSLLLISLHLPPPLILKRRPSRRRRHVLLQRRHPLVRHQRLPRLMPRRNGPRPHTGHRERFGPNWIELRLHREAVVVRGCRVSDLGVRPVSFALSQELGHGLSWIRILFSFLLFEYMWRFCKEKKEWLVTTSTEPIMACTEKE